MKGSISGETPFKCIKSTFTIGATTNGYTLNYSTSKEGPYTAYSQATPANEVLIVNGATPLMWFKLSGNVDDNVKAIF